MNSEAIWPFYAGILAQAVFLLLGQFERTDFMRLLGSCGGSLIGLIPIKNEQHYGISFHLFAVACAFSIGYALLFKEKVLERINKEILMVWTLVGFYIAMQTPLITTHSQALIALSVLSVIPIINAFAGFDRSYGWKVYFYIWFLCVLVGIAASKFAFSTVANIFWFHHGDENLSALTVFFVGMSFLYLAVNLWYVLELIPIPGKQQSFSDRLENIQDDMEILADDYDDLQVQWWKTVLLLVISGSSLAINYFKHFVSDETLIPYIIVLLPVVDKFRLPTKAPVQTIASTGTQVQSDE